MHAFLVLLQVAQVRGRVLAKVTGVLDVAVLAPLVPHQVVRLGEGVVALVTLVA